MRGKDLLPGRSSLSRSSGIAAAILVMLCCRGGSAQSERLPADAVRVDREVKIKVEGDDRTGLRLKIDPEVFVARLEEQVTKDALAEIDRLIEQREVLEAEIEGMTGKEGAAARIDELATKIEEVAKKEDSVKRGGPGELLKTGGPGVTFVVDGLRPGYSIEIDFRSQGDRKGPFLLKKPTPGRLRGRYVFHGRASTTSQRLRSGRVDIEHFPKPSVWKYEVVLRKGSEDLVAIDPMGVLI